MPTIAGLVLATDRTKTCRKVAIAAAIAAAAAEVAADIDSDSAAAADIDSRAGVVDAEGSRLAH